METRKRQIMAPPMSTTSPSSNSRVGTSSRANLSLVFGQYPDADPSHDKGAERAHSEQNQQRPKEKPICSLTATKSRDPRRRQKSRTAKEKHRQQRKLLRPASRLGGQKCRGVPSDHFDEAPS